MKALHGLRALEENGVGSAGFAKLEAFERRERDVVYNSRKEVQQSSRNLFDVGGNRLRINRGSSDEASINPAHADTSGSLVLAFR